MIAVAKLLKKSQNQEARVAYDYYKTAVELAQSSSPNFDYASVNNRINTLSKLLN